MKPKEYGLNLLLYIKDFRHSGAKLTPLEVEALGRAAERVGTKMVELVYKISASGSGPGLGSIREVADKDLESLYYYFLDECHKSR